MKMTSSVSTWWGGRRSHRGEAEVATLYSPAVTAGLAWPGLVGANCVVNLLLSTLTDYQVFQSQTFHIGSLPSTPPTQYNTTSA